MQIKMGSLGRSIGLSTGMWMALLLSGCGGADVASVSGSLTANGVTAHPNHVRAVEGKSMDDGAIVVVISESDAGSSEDPVRDLLLMRLGSGIAARFSRSDLHFIGVIVAHPDFNRRGVNLNDLFYAEDVSLDNGVLRAHLAPGKPLEFMGNSVELDLSFEVSVP